MLIFINIKSILILILILDWSLGKNLYKILEISKTADNK